MGEDVLKHHHNISDLFYILLGAILIYGAKGLATISPLPELINQNFAVLFLLGYLLIREFSWKTGKPKLIV